jgi:hypothetical protein
MSFPAHNDAEHGVSSSDWTAFESEETRRLHDSIVVAAELLKRDARGLALAEHAIPDQRLADQRFEGDFQLAGIHDGCFELEPVPHHYGLPALRATATPPHLAEIDDWFGFGTMIKLGAVAGLAVGVAFVTLNTPSPAGIATAPQETRSSIFSTAALSGLAQIGAAQAKVQPDAAISGSPVLASASTVLAATQANTDPAMASPAPVAAPMTMVAPPAAAKITPPPAPEMSPPSVAVAPPPTSHTTIARNEVAALMQRGRSLLAAGDISSARLILARVAESGEAEASLLLAGTFDPAELARLNVVGATPDVTQARAWYAKAAEQGSPEGSRRLQQLTLR